MKDANALNWFEIPVSDFERARNFYSAILDFDMQVHTMGKSLMGFFPYQPGSGKVSGAILKEEGYKPSKNGSLIYLNGDPDLKTILSRVETAGGSIHKHKTEISPEVGYCAEFIDTEGNRVALHSQK